MSRTAYYECCTSFYSWQIPVRGSEGRLYQLTYGMKGHKFDSGRDYGCTCPAYKYRTGYCKHIIDKQRFHCNWHEPIASPDSMMGTCPQCGRPTRLEVMQEEEETAGGTP